MKSSVSAASYVATARFSIDAAVCSIWTSMVLSANAGRRDQHGHRGAESGGREHARPRDTTQQRARRRAGRRDRLRRRPAAVRGRARRVRRVVPSSWSSRRSGGPATARAVSRIPRSSIVMRISPCEVGVGGLTRGVRRGSCTRMARGLREVADCGGRFVLTATPPAVSVVIASPSGRPATVNATTRRVVAHHAERDRVLLASAPTADTSVRE